MSTAARPPTRQRPAPSRCRARRRPLLAAAAALAGCAAGPPPPDWQAAAHAALEQAVAADLEGQARVATVELARARAQLARTGRPELLARAELRACAARVASLDFGPCSGFAPLRADAGTAERAYADYLYGGQRTLTPAERDALPPPQRAVAAAAAAGPQAAAQALAAVADPLSRLVAAGVLLRTGQASPPVLALALDTASAQGWRRPLLAWLGVALQRAQAAGDAEAAARLRRRLALVQLSGGPAGAAAEPASAAAHATPTATPVRP